MIKESDIQKAAAILTGGKEPLAYDLKQDGSLVVVASNGMKFIFPPERVQSVLEASKIIKKPSAKPKSKKATSSTSKKGPGRPPRASSKPHEPKKS